MEAQDFRTMVDRLGDLTEVQPAALAAALAGQGSASEAIAMSEMRFALAPACGHCKSERFGGWGKASGLKPYMYAIAGAPSTRSPALRWRSCTVDAWLDYARAHGRPHQPAPRSRRISRRWWQPMLCSSPTAAPPTASSPTPPVSRTSPASPAPASASSAATTCRTSMGIRAASRAGWRRSTASHRGYLPSYFGWRRMIERDAGCLTPPHIITVALG